MRMAGKPILRQIPQPFFFFMGDKTSLCFADQKLETMLYGWSILSLDFDTKMNTKFYAGYFWLKINQKTNRHLEGRLLPSLATLARHLQNYCSAFTIKTN